MLSTVHWDLHFSGLTLDHSHKINKMLSTQKVCPPNPIRLAFSFTMWPISTSHLTYLVPPYTRGQNGQNDCICSTCLVRHHLHHRWIHLGTLRILPYHGPGDHCQVHGTPGQNGPAGYICNTRLNSLLSQLRRFPTI